MDLIKEIYAHNFEIGYDINIYRDADDDKYVARLRMFSHPVAPRLIPGEPTPIMEDLGEEELISEDIGSLMQQCRNRVSKSDTKRIIFEVKDVDS